MTEDIFFDDTWTVYYHDPNTTDWTTSSYHLLSVLSSVEDYWVVFNSVRHTIHKGMFFCMREHIFPCWDDPYNINGGTISLQIPTDSSIEYFEKLVKMIVGGCIGITEVNGVSIGPKRYFNIIKIWLPSCDDTWKSVKDRLPIGYMGSPKFIPSRKRMDSK